MFLILFCLISTNALVSAYLDLNVPDHKYGLDLNLYESVLDPELCDEQMNFILQNDTELMLTFLDAGIRTPRGIITGNTLDLGNYYQCLGISKEIPDSVVEGKYCLVEVPLNQNINWPELPEFPSWPDIPWPDFPWPELESRTSRLSDKVIKGLEDYNVRKSQIDAFVGGKVDTRISRVADDSQLAGTSLRLAVCIPKACSTENALRNIVNASELGLNYREQFCRLPNDKPWVAGDYVAVVIFAVILSLAILSTAYDVRHNVFLRKDPKKINKLGVSFSVYTNTRRLVTYNPVPGAIECLDGVRSFAMMWVIIGHTFVNQVSSGIMANPLDAVQWMMSLSSVWITAAPITVDTFFMLSGLLLVYTTHGKVKPMKLLKNLHLFYLNRLLRIFPVLAAMILIQISFLNWIVDGPFWSVVLDHTHRCRVYWWSTLLHIQNFVNPNHMCLAHSWYLAIDIQLHILSPIILVWVLTGRRRLSWIALFGGLIAALTASTVYNFINEFPSGPIIPSRPDDQPRYIMYYYVNTLTRASPFFVGLIFGYLLSIYRGQKVIVSKISATILWVCSAAIGFLTIYSSYPIMQLDWDNQVADSMINSFMRPGWAMAVGWMIFACVHGYGGIINWILCLRMWKVLGRLSYAMYITHYPMIFVVNAMPVAPVFFNVPFSVLKFFIDFGLAVFVSFVVTILVDSPCSVLIKHFLGGGVKKAPVKVVEHAEVEEKKTQL
ncbi:nose resistant to fluoxetine protein 6-like [Anticarsia gemmatalis]|uniref:nose resistant to fluoxetine protein 6-like n=1 Tax=Anticarsia gemmatalis TaxID=129554 RepID=UPI003F76D4F0